MSNWNPRMLWLLMTGILLLTAGCGGSMGLNREGADVTGDKGAVKGKSPADVYIQLAGAYLRQGNMVAALENAKKAVAADPGKSQSANILAAVYQALGEDKLAEKYYKRALRLDSQDSDAANAYGSFLCGKARYEEADKYFRQSLTNPLYRSPWLSYTNAGICAKSSGKMEKAEEYFRQALTSNPGYPPAILNMAQLSYDKGDYQGSRDYLYRYTRVSRVNAPMLYLAIQTERGLGNYDQARTYERLLRTDFPDAVEVQKLNQAQ